MFIAIKKNGKSKAFSTVQAVNAHQPIGQENQSVTAK
jgi:hypothetical protein